MVPPVPEHATLPNATIPMRPLRIAYLVHDLSDPAIARRVRQLAAAGAALSVMGFQRGPDGFAPPPGVTVHCLGTTQDGRLVRRALSVLRVLLAGGRDAAGPGLTAASGADVIIARQLEMLLIACRLRSRLSTAALAYECLDIHSLMTARSPSGWLLRRLERWLLRRCALLAVSSLGFIRSYFTPVHGRLPVTLLLENKVVRAELPDATLVAIEARRRRPACPGPPWRIGWFGVIRCRRSLDILAGLVRRSQGRVEVVIRGRVAAAIPGFDAIVAATPGLTFHGPYHRPTELAAIHAGIHFAWAVDYYEAAANSEWLLPNRIYEASLCGAVPIARAATETAAWLMQRSAGVVLADPMADSLLALFDTLDADRCQDLRNAVLRIPLDDLLSGADDAAHLVQALRVASGASA